MDQRIEAFDLYTLNSYLNFRIWKKAIWLKNNEDNEDEESDKEDEEVILKCPKNLNEDLNEFLKEWEYHTSVLTSNDIINVYELTKEPNTSKYMVVMESLDKNTSKKLNESLEKFGVIGY
ncbi:kinase-like domain-containing protein [Rhizophagus irregularis DAOM 181602=DAOM 197198]|nr:kinase-like domain-containing protein [Rhizophagus irregularis DAOM 181602=DAOM 197198]